MSKLSIFILTFLLTFVLVTIIILSLFSVKPPQNVKLSNDFCLLFLADEGGEGILQLTVVRCSSMSNSIESYKNTYDIRRDSKLDVISYDTPMDCAEISVEESAQYGKIISVKKDPICSAINSSKPWQENRDSVRYYVNEVGKLVSLEK